MADYIDNYGRTAGPLQINSSGSWLTYFHAIEKESVTVGSIQYTPTTPSDTITSATSVKKNVRYLTVSNIRDMDDNSSFAPLMAAHPLCGTYPDGIVVRTIKKLHFIEEQVDYDDNIYNSFIVNMSHERNSSTWKFYFSNDYEITTITDFYINDSLVYFKDNQYSYNSVWHNYIVNTELNYTSIEITCNDNVNVSLTINDYGNKPFCSLNAVATVGWVMSYASLSPGKQTLSLNDIVTQEKFDALVEKVNINTQNITTLFSTCEDFEERITLNTTNIATNTQDIADIKEDIEEIETDIEWAREVATKGIILIGWASDSDPSASWSDE